MMNIFYHNFNINVILFQFFIWVVVTESFIIIINAFMFTYLIEILLTMYFLISVQYFLIRVIRLVYLFIMVLFFKYNGECLIVIYGLNFLVPFVILVIMGLDHSKILDKKLLNYE